jgi:cytochrome b-561
MEGPTNESGTPEWLQTNPSYNATEDTSSAPTEQYEGRSPCTPSMFLQRIQKIATITSLLLSPVSIILVSLWVSQKAVGGGGVSWKQGDSGRVFNWHPVLMVTAYALMNVGVLIFRASGTSVYQSSLSTSAEAYPRKRGIMKTIHGAIWSLDVVFGIVAMLAVFKSHNDPISGYIANLYSFHSWVGILVLSLFTLQFIVGIVSFSGLAGSASRFGTPLLMEIHKYTGTYIHILATATILLGIQEKEGFIGCSYKVTAPDLFPLANYGLIPTACKISHSLGLVILAMGICTTFAVARFPTL